MYAGRPTAHLFLEFFGETPPEDDAVILLLGLAPTLAVILVSRRLIEQEPAVARLLETTAGDKKWGVKKTRGMIALGTAALLFLIVICIPLEKSASGEAVVVPWERGVAFSNIESLVEKVFVDEGGSVNAGDPIAQLDPTDLQYKMESAERQAEILAKKIALLQREADTNPEKLADRKIVELERQKALKDFQYFKKQFEYLTIRAPQDGVVVTRDLKSLVGKKFRTGEPVCEIAEPSHYAVEISVPEEKVGPTNAGMTGFLYLNNNPMDGIGIVVETVAPEAEATPRLGNVFRVTCKLKSPREGLKIGMKGTAKIVTGSESIASGAIHGAVGLRRRLSLYF
jgi:multidrug resistance efflux pump